VSPTAGYSAAGTGQLATAKESFESLRRPVGQSALPLKRSIRDQEGAPNQLEVRLEINTSLCPGSKSQLAPRFRSHLL
jgi:hypothetical protein